MSKSIQSTQFEIGSRITACDRYRVFFDAREFPTTATIVRPPGGGPGGERGIAEAAWEFLKETYVVSKSMPMPTYSVKYLGSAPC